MNPLWLAPLASPLDRLVLLALAELGAVSGPAVISQGAIADITGLAERSVRASLARLEGLGIICRNANHRAGSRLADTITITSSDQWPRAEMRKERPAFVGSVRMESTGTTCRGINQDILDEFNKLLEIDSLPESESFPGSPMFEFEDMPQPVRPTIPPREPLPQSIEQEIAELMGSLLSAGALLHEIPAAWTVIPRDQLLKNLASIKARIAQRKPASTWKIHSWGYLDAALRRDLGEDYPEEPAPK